MHLVKIKILGKEPATPDGWCKHMGGEDTSPTNPERSALESAR